MVRHRSRAAMGVRPVLAAALVLLAAAPASAQLFVEASAGAGWSAGHYRYSRVYAPGRVAFGDSGMAGPAVALELTLGLWHSREFALGVSAEGELAVFVESARFLYDTLDAHLLAACQGWAAWRFAPQVALALRVGWARASFTGGQEDIGAADNLYDFEPASGPAGGLGLAWRSEGAFGLEARGRVGFLTGTFSEYQPLTFLLAASWSGWR